MKIKNFDFGVAAVVEGVLLVNTTPHPITFEEAGVPVSVPTSKLLNARAVEESAGEFGGVSFVKTSFVGTPEGEALIEAIRQEAPDAVIVGSIIAAQAFPGKVVAMTPMPGFERVAPAEKRMNPRNCLNCKLHDIIVRYGGTNIEIYKFN